MPDRGKNAIDVILGRRSVRKFISDIPVPKEDIELMYSIMGKYFQQIVATGYTGVTLSEYICAWKAGKNVR